MKLMSLQLLKDKRRSKDKGNKRLVNTKRLEYSLQLELLDMLDKELTDNERVLIEVNKDLVGSFINILGDKITSLYSYEQVEINKFIFKSREIEL